jgi:hypothetical protein
MLRDADDVRLEFEPARFGPGWLVLDIEDQDRRRLRQLADEHEFGRLLGTSGWVPVRVARIGESTLWLFRNQFLWDDGQWLSQADVHAEMDARRARRLAKLFGSTRSPAVVVDMPVRGLT